jgi:hypothetical protein
MRDSGHDLRVDFSPSNDRLSGIGVTVGNDHRDRRIPTGWHQLWVADPIGDVAAMDATCPNL